MMRACPSARLVARYLELGHPDARLIATLGHALLREDADFHTYQTFEAELRQYREWGATPEGRNILIAITRYLAACADRARPLPDRDDRPASASGREGARGRRRRGDSRYRLMSRSKRVSSSQEGAAAARRPLSVAVGMASGAERV
jgi:hypothetical protein